MYEKNCAACGESKGPECFYTADRKCKECRKAMVKAAREANPEHYKAFDKARAMRPDRVAARAAYALTEAGIAARARASKRWMIDNKTRNDAHIAVNNAVRDGRLVKEPCAVCGCLEVEGHHFDYSRPLLVTWLCTKHHAQLHKEHRTYTA